MRAKHGYALLWDAHSIPSVVPRLFDGELPELNIGTADGRSCAVPVEAAVVDAARDGPYSIAVNGRFKGGYITRQYGRPDDGVHAVQLEIAQRAYMNEATTVFDAEKAGRLREILRQMLQAFLDAAREHA
jgi:N-formylglutamate amidohydrolase